MVTVIGLDIGHSAVKMVVKGNAPFRECFPSAVIAALQIQDDSAAQQTADDTVTHEGQSWFVGQTAVMQGSRNFATQTGLHANWITSPQYAALMKAALEKAARRGNDLSKLVIVHGLPQVDMGLRKQELNQVVHKVAPHAKSSILSQPMGAFYAYMLESDATPAHGDDALKQAWALIDVGYYSSDYVLMDRGHRIERASGSYKGVNEIVTELGERFRQETRATTQPAKIMAAIEEYTDKGAVILKSFGKPFDLTDDFQAILNTWYAQFIDATQNALDEYVASLDGVIIAGGGAPLLFPLLSQKWPHVMLLDDSRFSVSEGFSRYGLLVARVTFPEEFPEVAAE